MKIWTRIVTFTVDRDLEMGIVLYPTKEAAYAAAREHGGIALPVDSADLKELYKPEQFSIEGVQQMHRSGVLRESSEDGDGAIFLENSFSVDATSFPHDLVPYPDSTLCWKKYGDEAQAWFQILEDELDAFVHVE
jgi:hypothetical protein